MSLKKINLADLEIVDGLPLILDVENKGLKANDWADLYKEAIEQHIKSNGAILVRGLKIYGSGQFGALLTKLFDAELLEYNYRSTPRTEMRGSVYTATEYPASEIIPQHNENAYARAWPSRIGFLCLLPAQTGGETPIGDNKLILNNLDKEITEKFERKGIMYVRNYSDLDLKWEEVFQTNCKNSVEQYCHDNALSFEWLAENKLRTKQINPATIIHPTSGEKLWFNQAHLFHSSNLTKEIESTLINNLGEDNLPRNTFYGDGTPIETEVLDIIRNEYIKTKITFKWQKNDLLLLDNLRFTHGRESFTGPRKVITGMA